MTKHIPGAQVARASTPQRKLWQRSAHGIWHRAEEDFDEVRAQVEAPQVVPRAAVQCTYWSTPSRSEAVSGFSLVNEVVPQGKKPLVDELNSAAYVHVDDGVFAAHDEDTANFLMHATADELENLGFMVSDRMESAALDTVVGYQVVKQPPGLRYPLAKAVRLAAALSWMVSGAFVHVETLRALVGVWMFGALLRRELLSIPGHVFAFIERHKTGTHRWWPSARREVKCMATLRPFMRIRFDTPAATTLFATDAMGASEDGDLGGYGIVA